MFKNFKKQISVLGIFSLLFFILSTLSPKIAFANFNYNQTGITVTATNYFGSQVVIDGDTLAISSFSRPGYLPQIPAVFIYKKVAGSWLQQAIISNNNFPNFGFPIALKGNTLAIYGSSPSSKGNIFVYHYNGSSWVLQSDISLGPGIPGSNYGANIALDGNILAVDLSASTPYQTSYSPIFIYAQSNGVWNYQTTLVPNGGYGNQLSLDNNTLAVVAPGASAHGGIDIFSYDGSAWSLQAGIHLTQAGSYLGSGNLANSISLKGNILAASSDVIYFFYRTGTTWTTTTPAPNVIIPPGIILGSSSYFGWTLSLSADGNNIVIGRPGGSTTPGEAYHYVHSSNTWAYASTLPRNDSQVDDSFGSSLSIYGNTIAVGAPKWWNDNTSRGKVYVYDFQVANNPPVVNPITNSTINEGDTYTASGLFTDPDSTFWIATVDYGDGSGIQPITLSGTNFSLSHLYKDEGNYTVTVKITDNQGATGTGTATVTVNNAPFTVSAITVITNPVQVNASTSASATFTDPGVLDTHTASWDWGDGSTTLGTVTESSGSGSVSNSHTYSVAGMYTVKLTVTDDDGLAVSSQYQYVNVYDPAAGSFGGIGTFNSPAGIYPANPLLTGSVTFASGARYQNGVLIGLTRILFPVANLTFQSTATNWLIVTKPKQTLQATGTINGSGTYIAIVSGIDGTLPNSGGVDKVRIKITNTANTVIYDSQIGQSITTDPTTSLIFGAIRIR